MLRFLEEYKKVGVDVWALTTQNEPVDGLLPDFSFNCMGYEAEDMRIFVRDYIGPTLRNSSFSDVKLFTVDDQRVLLSLWTDTVCT